MAAKWAILLDVIFAIRLKRKKDKRKEELSAMLLQKCKEGRFDRKVSLFGKTSTLRIKFYVKQTLPVLGFEPKTSCSVQREGEVKQYLGVTPSEW